ncbi:hypothetical protein T265_12936, partial [Opisthorchis viverrini]
MDSAKLPRHEQAKLVNDYRLLIDQDKISSKFSSSTGMSVEDIGLLSKQDIFLHGKPITQAHGITGATQSAESEDVSKHVSKEGTHNLTKQAEQSKTSWKMRCKPRISEQMALKEELKRMQSTQNYPKNPRYKEQTSVEATKDSFVADPKALCFTSYCVGALYK